MRLAEAKAELIDKVIKLAGENLPAADLEGITEFIRHYYADTVPEDLVPRDVIDVYGATLAHWQLAQTRSLRTPRIRVYTPEFDAHGWQSSHSVIEIVCDNMPFLVDSITMELSRSGYGIYRVVHPVFSVRRDVTGRLLEASPIQEPDPEGVGEAFIQVEFDRQTDATRLDALAENLTRVLADVQAAVEDWGAMGDLARGAASQLRAVPPPCPSDEVLEAAALLDWMVDDHFIFLGHRLYDLLQENGEDVLRAVPGSGLGILRQSDAPVAARSFAKLPPEIRHKAHERVVLNLTKANARSTVHRPGHLDYVGVKEFDESGKVVRERRFLGQYTAGAYRASPFDIPVLRRKVQAVVQRAGFAPDSHSGKALIETLEGYPRDELFQVSVDDLFDTAMGIMRLQERQRLRLFVRRESFGRYMSCLVYVPRDRYNTTTRERMQRVLLDAFHGVDIEYSTSVSESVLARLHFVVRTRPGEVPDYDVAEIEAHLADAVRSWTDDLSDALVEQCGEGAGVDLFRRYAEGFPASYRDDFPARAAVADIRRIEALNPSDDLAMSLYHPLEAGPDFLRFKLFRTGEPMPVSDVLPVLENMGVRVVDERPYALKPQGRPPLWIYDYGLRYAAGGGLETDQVKEIFQDAFARVWHGEVDNDGFNRLVLRARLTWREVTILRAYCKYLRQAGTTFSQSYMEETLAAHPDIARALVELFHTRFDPTRQADVEEKTATAVAALEAALDEVSSLDEDRILRNFLQLTMATLRTNYFRKGADGVPKPYLSLKLDPAHVPDLPLPRPHYEIFVFSPAVEGVHLRGGKVARGGIRWSDRREDFRTEILGLMKAQMVKNAVIVPVGAKGGFVVKRPPQAPSGSALMDEVVACYRTFICALLDITDNMVGGGVVAPPDVVRYDSDDPYLVVAADKGTATFSDIANAIAMDYGYWLGDAFASGGSSGYDHKKMGITAKGAWESVKRHFRTLGVDIQTTDFTVVGIGDMCGDVFGNGMLLSQHIKLVAAFDHRHIFLDPNPDPETSFAERKRVADIPSSCWADYNPELISPGGGVFPRKAKSIPLSVEARNALGIMATHVTPNELVSAVLKAPVDLLWNGGIGTYVKASTESHADVGDKANDAVRIDADELRCRVVGEGGNLGFTQRGRIEYAQAGGLINTDAIDNSAGVDLSDHEVNIKVLLDAVVADGDLTVKQRDALIVEMTDQVTELVLEDNYAQTEALSNSLAQASGMVDVHARYLRALEQENHLNRAVEFLPDHEELMERKSVGRGLVAPEFATLMAYVKITLQRELLESDLPEDPYFPERLAHYFPSALRERFAHQIQEHRLRRELIATGVVNKLVNGAGTTFVFRLGEETGASVADVARAHIVASEVFELGRLWEEIESLDNAVAADVQTKMLLEVRKLAERATRWLLRSRRTPLDIAATINDFAADAAAIEQRLPEILVGKDRKAVDSAAEQLVAAGVPASLAQQIAGSVWLFSALDISEVAHETGQAVPEVAAIYFALGERLELDWLRDTATALPRNDRWQALARAAVRDDIYADHVALTAQVVRSGHTGLSADACIDDWVDRNKPAVERFESVLSEIQGRGLHDLTALSVAVREMRSLIQVSGAGR